jgi:predicted Zn-dependent protease
LGTERFSLAKETRLAVGDDGSSGAVAEIEKEFGVVQDEALIKRVSEIGAKIVVAAERVGPRQIITDRVAPGTEAPKLQFTFKVLNSPEVNAFSIWGGRLYVTKGLLDYVQSDDELAAVMSHEMGHTMRHHLNKQQRIEETATNYQLWTIVAGWLGGNSVDLESVLLTSEWVKYAILSKYSVHDEAEADYLGVLYCHAAGYNPVGLLTFMQRLARDTYNQPNIEGGRDQPGPGATQTHPWSKDRAQAIRHQIIDQLHLPIKYQAVIALPRIEARAATVNGTEIAEVLFEGAVIFQPADKGAQESPLARAQALADELLRLMKEQDLHARHLRLEAQKPLLKAFLRGKYVPVLEVLPGDAEFHRKEARALARETFQTLRGAMQGYELRNQKI